MSAQESSKPRGPYLLSMPCAPAISDLPGDEINFWCVGTHWPFAPLSGWETVNDYFHGFCLCPTRKKCFNRHVFFHPRPNEQEMHGYICVSATNASPATLWHASGELLTWTIWPKKE